jgi:para-nitrobenzyl esterase
MQYARVETAAGWVQGSEREGVRSWLGVPYAAPPVGALRFRPPEPVKPWPGTRAAVRPGPRAVQFIPGAARTEVEGAEDCLTVNVWSPARPADQVTGGLPVLFWVHGGAFLHGSGSDFDGTRLAGLGEVVVVTVNYRLGPLGFAYLEHLGPRFAGTANAGVRDLIAALEWVRANIAGFGGDPGRVTVVGQSAGAMLTTTLLGTPAARGLFHQAVALSGAARHVYTAEQGAEVTRRLLAFLHIPQERADRLLHLPLAALGAATAAVVAGAGDATLRGDSFQPVVDGALLPQSPLAAVASGAARHIPLWVGTCRHEMDLFARVPPGREPAPCVPGTEAAARAELGEAGWARVRQEYADTAEPGRDPDLDLLADIMWWLPAVRLAEAQHTAGGRVWFSRTDHAPAVPPYDLLGPTHGADNRCLWADAERLHQLAHFGPAPLMGTDDRAVADLLQRSVLTFTRTGVPGGDGLRDGLVWPTYSPGDRATLIIQADPRIRFDPRRQRRLIWQDLSRHAATP